MHLSRVALAEFDVADGTVSVHKHYADSVPYCPARYDPSELGEALVAQLRAGTTAVQAAVRDDASSCEADRRAHSRPLTEAFVVVPVFDGGRLAALFFVDSRFERAWTREEVWLIESVAERVYDALQRARAARRLEESEQRLRLAQEACGICIYDLDLVSGTQRWDEGVRELWGLGPDDVVTWESLRAGVSPEDAARVDAAVARTRDPAGDGTMSVEHGVHRKDDGRDVRVVVTGLVTFRGGIPVRMVGTVQDVTDLREAEFALRDTDRRKDEFLAMLAHELRNPLAPLRNALHYVRRCAVPESCVEPLQMATRQVAQLTRLVDDLLELSRIGLGTLGLQPERVMVQQALRHAVEALSSTLAERSQRLQCELPDMSLWVDADPTRFAQIVGNLLGNAPRYSDAGCTITLRARRQGSEVILEVQDEGIGIDARNLPRVFDLFAQADAGSNRSRGGLGIGLSLVLRLLEAQGGRVAAASDGLGKGSTFTVWLPATDGGAH